MTGSHRALDALALRDWAHSAVDDLIMHIDEINRLNVFPIADSDTGTNMVFTMRSAVAEVDAAVLAGSDPTDVAEVAAALSAGALHGARGNSGVILSQILRGIADITAAAAQDCGARLHQIDEIMLGAALGRAVDLVIASMGGHEVPGTIVSVLRAAAGAVERCIHAGGELGHTIVAADDAAAKALEKTPEQLEVLGDAGVVDAGGRGLLVLLDALRATITGLVPARSAYQLPPQPAAIADATQTPAPQFEVMYALEGCDNAGVAVLRDQLEQCGESVVIAASSADSSPGPAGYSVHVHTDDAGTAVEAGFAVGRPSRIQISVLAGGGKIAPGGWTRERAVLAVVDGDEAAELFAGEGACVLRSDPAAALSAHQLLRGIVDTGAAHVMVLPNGYIAAEELVAGCTAAIGWGIEVVPLPAGSMVQGLAALAVHEPGRPSVDDGYLMARAAGATRCGSVRVATEKALTWAGACEPGNGLGITGDEVLIVAPNITQAAVGLLDLLVAVGGELVTVLVGAEITDAVGGPDRDVPGLLQRHVHDQHPGIELVIYRTGHHGDALLLGVE